MSDPNARRDDPVDPASTPPSVTVVVPTHQRPTELRRAVSAILAQRYAGPIEIIVVFDKSEIAEVDVSPPAGRRVTCLANTRRPGLPGARNTGLLEASGDLIAFCDDDDEWLPDKLHQQVAALTARPEAHVVGCGITLCRDDRAIPRAIPAGPVTLAELVRHRVMELHSSTILARRGAALDDIGLLDEDIPGGYYEDYDWLLRAGRIAPIPIVQSHLVRVAWVTDSFFIRRWSEIAQAAAYLLDKHPEFRSSPVGTARLQGQIAFFQAAVGHRRESCRWAVRALRHSPRERRAYLALAVAARLLSAERVLRLAHARGRGI
jgi:glycosyltransferase involved in cell wall biosynthesis